MGEEELFRAVVRGDTRAAARAARLVDERGQGHFELLRELYPHSQRAWFIGVTGSPGVGKSTLVDALVQHARGAGRRVAVVAVDPTSPFSGGAILGDRIRMQRHFADPNVFIRSVATRGALGGLSRSVSAIARVLAAWGADVVLLETIGVGQDELDVMQLAHSTLVVMAPGAGDDVQAAKAGITECADVFAVNKADLPGADATAVHLRSMLALAQVKTLGSLPPSHAGTANVASPPRAAAAPQTSSDWAVPVLTCVASKGTGVAAVYGELEKHFAWLTSTSEGRARRAARLRQDFIRLLRDSLVDAALLSHADAIEAAAQDIITGKTDPYSASRDIVQRVTATG